MLRTLFAFSTVITLAAGVGLGASSVASAAMTAFGCDDASGLCVEGGSFEADKRTTDKDRKKQSKSSAGNLSLEIDGGRGSLFINGRYAGTAPLNGIEIPSGPNDIQIRDGAEVLATGVLTVPKDASVSLTARHD
jgi:hypothetical protein